MEFTESKPDINKDVLKLLYGEFIPASCADYEKNVALVWDEMRIKSGLVLSRGTGDLIGFVQADEFSTSMDNLANFGAESQEDDQLATHIMVFMVDGLMCHANIPFLWFPSVGFTATELYGSVWEATQSLEDLGLTVRAWACDGATPTRKFFKLNFLDDCNSETQNLH